MMGLYWRPPYLRKLLGSKQAARECLFHCSSLETTASGFSLNSELPGSSNVVPFWVWYGFVVRILNRTTKKVLHWRV